MLGLVKNRTLTSKLFFIDRIIFSMCKTRVMCSAECDSYNYNITLGSINDEGFRSMVTDMGLICDKAWIVPFVWSLFSIGNALGSLFGGPISDRLGRRRAIFYTNLCVIFGGF